MCRRSMCRVRHSRGSSCQDRAFAPASRYAGECSRTARRRRPDGSYNLNGLTMALTPADVDHVAALARLGITAEERERFAQQLSGILEHFQALQALDTAQIPPT